ncbi:methyltransferase domain-containing protein [Streptomyces naphthomycinicus]|uniref:methyltransferase domain-containing protein n=1 Tax=Streptomyces naphthomycinicus TaxID=2872625 RepID=UPI001CED61E7|nr:methyltransferase domain-containing protein [Streptomyces sp. TML10]
MSVDMSTLDEAKLNELLGKVVTDLGAVAAAPLALLGERLGLFRALVDGEAVTPGQLAERTRTTERNVREWLAAMAASGYLTYEGGDRFRMAPEQSAVFADENSPVFALGGYQSFLSCGAAGERERLERAFRDGHGVGWHEHHPDLFAGTARFFRPAYATYLVDEWLPALTGVVEKLSTGGRAADVGCGLGHSTVMIGKAFPGALVTGFDTHGPSVDRARELAAEVGVEGQVSFEAAGAKDFTGGPYELIAFFDCLHDMGDPAGALAHSREQLAEGGSIMLVEPLAGDRLEENLTPLGRAFYSASTLICTPASQSQEVGRALGAQAGEERTREVASEAGLTRFRRAAQTPFNVVYEARV